MVRLVSGEAHVTGAGEWSTNHSPKFAGRLTGFHADVLDGALLFGRGAEFPISRDLLEATSLNIDLPLLLYPSGLFEKAGFNISEDAQVSLINGRTVRVARDASLIFSESTGLSLVASDPFPT